MKNSKKHDICICTASLTHTSDYVTSIPNPIKTVLFYYYKLLYYNSKYYSKIISKNNKVF